MAHNTAMIRAHDSTIGEGGSGQAQSVGQSAFAHQPAARQTNTVRGAFSFRFHWDTVARSSVEFHFPGDTTRTDSGTRFILCHHEPKAILFLLDSTGLWGGLVKFQKHWPR